MSDDIDSLREQLAEANLLEALLGSAMRKPELAQTLVACGFSEADIDHATHKAIWRVILRLHQAGKRADHRIVETMLVDEAVDLDTARDFIAACMRNEVEDPAGAAVTAYVAVVKTRVGLRRLRALAQSVIRMTLNTAALPAEIVASTSAELDAVMRGAVVMRTITGPDITRLALERLNAPEDEPSRFIPVGVDCIDNSVGGVPRQGMTVIAAQRKAGKTTRAKHIALHAARNGFKVLLVSLEPPARELSEGLAEIVAGVKLPTAKARDMPAPLQSKVRVAAESFEVTSVMIEKLSWPTAEEVAATIYAYVQTERVDLVIIDYIQKMAMSTRHQNNEANYAHQARVLEACADRCPQTALVLFSQMKGDEKDRSGKKLEHDDPVPQTQEWSRLAYLVALLKRDSRSEDALTRSITKEQLIFNRPNGLFAESYSRYNMATARLHTCDDGGNLLGESPYPDEERLMPTPPLPSRIPPPRVLAHHASSPWDDDDA